jgi:nitroreductase
LRQAQVMLIGTDTFWRNSWKYRARAYRHSFWDAGTILANLLAAATAHEVAAQVALGFVDSSVNALVDLDTNREVTTFLVGLGTGAPAAEAAPPVTPLNLEVEPLSRQEVDYPAIRLTHAASCLEHPEEVAEWRESAPLLTLPVASGPLIALQPAGDEALLAESIEAVIRRRGSTRQFTHEPLTLTQLSNVLVRATQEFPVDVLQGPNVSLSDLYLIVHAVTDVPAGAYVFHGHDQSLELLREGQFRREAGMLALGQDLAADASVDVFLLCDLRQVLELMGNRGYRAAQLEAGLLGGRMYLAAYAQGLGASGLTFFDDEVTGFFSPHAAGKSVMFLVALGHSSRRQRR